jgi:L-arabinose isomerase
MGINTNLPKAGLVLFEANWFSDLGIGESGSSMGDLNSLIKHDKEKILSGLKKIVNVVYPGSVHDMETANTALEVFKTEKVDVIIFCYVTWSEDLTLIEMLKNIREIPVIYWQFLTGFYTSGKYAPIELYHNCGVVGSLQGSASLKKFGKKFKLVIGEAGDSAAMAKIASYSKAAMVKSVLKNSTIGLLPFRNDQMRGTIFDEFMILKKTGLLLQMITLAELKNESRNIESRQTEEFIKSNKKLFKIDKNLNERDYMQAARVSLAMSNLYIKYKLNALALNDVSYELHGIIGLRPCLYPGIYNEIGAIIGLEGDVGVTIAMYILHLLTQKPVSFTEVLNYNPSGNTLNAGHPGPSNPMLASSGKSVTVVPDIEYMNSNDKYKYSGALEFIGAPGPVTMINMLDTGETIQMVVSSGTSLGGEIRVSHIPHFCIKMNVPVFEFLEKAINAGTTQHFAVVHGDLINNLEDLAGIMNFDIIVI